MTFEKIKARYEKNYITDAQLLRFKTLGIISEEQYTELYDTKYPDEDVVGITGEAYVPVNEEEAE